MGRSKNDVWLGLFVMIGLAALVFLALQAANLLSLNFQPTYRITAQFDNIGGLKPKAAVRSGGVVVGRVAGISFDDERYQARIDLDMDTRFKFPKDSSLKILTSGLLGESYVGLQPGGDPDVLKSGDEIVFTQPAVDLIQLVGKYMFSGGGNNATESTPGPHPTPTKEEP